MSGVGTWRVVLDSGAVHAIEARSIVLFAGKREWQKATFGEAVWGSFDGPLEAVTGLAKSLRWKVLEYVPPGALTRAEAVAAAVANVRAQCYPGGNVSEEKKDDVPMRLDPLVDPKAPVSTAKRFHVRCMQWAHWCRMCGRCSACCGCPAEAP